MPLLTKYLLREYLKTFFMILAVLLLTSLSIEILEKIRKFSSYQAESVWIVQYFLYRLPTLLFDIFPIVTLVSTLLTMGLFARNHELVAAGAAGVSPLRFVSPLLVFAAIITLILFSLNQTFIPLTYRTAKMTQTVHIEKRRDVGFSGDALWLRIAPRTLAYVRQIAPDRMHRVRIYALGEDFSLQQQTEAAFLIYEGGNWILKQGSDRTFLPNGGVIRTPFDERQIILHQTPDNFQGMRFTSNQMTDRQMRDVIRHLSEDHLDSTHYRVDLQAKRALPFANLVMAFIGVSLGMTLTTPKGIALGLGMALGYWLLFSAMTTLGHQSVLSPILAAWGTNFLFLAVGLYGIFKTSTPYSLTSP